MAVICCRTPASTVLGSPKLLQPTVRATNNVPFDPFLLKWSRAQRGTITYPNKTDRKLLEKEKVDQVCWCQHCGGWVLYRACALPFILDGINYLGVPWSPGPDGPTLTDQEQTKTNTNRRPRHPKCTKTPATKTWSETPDPTARLREFGEAQEHHRKPIGKLRGAAVHRSGYFYKMVKRWCTGLIAQDIAVRAPSTGSLLHTLDTLHKVAHTMGLRFNKDKTEVYHLVRDYNVEPITWQHQLIPVRPPILTSLGHVLAHPTQEETTWDMVTTQLHHDIAAYRTLPLNAFEKVAIINTVLIPRWTCRGLFLGNRSRMALWDGILLHYIRDTPGIEQQMNKH